MDFIFNGQANGDVAAKLMASNYDPRILRPYIAENGRSYVDVTSHNAAGIEVVTPMTLNTPASLRKDDWILLDTAVIKVAKQRLKAVADLLGMGLRFDIPNGMAKSVLQSETQSDISAATISMDGLRKGTDDRPVFELENLPLPIIHKDFDFSSRQVMISRNGGSPIDTTTAELAGRNVAEEAEKLLIGTAGSYKYGGGNIYGYTNYPHRLTATITSPEAVGWTGGTLVSEVLSMRQQSQTALHFGPWMLYVSTAWDQYIDEDYSSAKGDNTVRARLKAIQGIEDVRTLDYLTGYDIVLVQMTSDVVREVMGMNLTTVQWASQGGFQLNFKVLAIMVPQIRADQNENTGIVHGTVAA